MRKIISRTLFIDYENRIKHGLLSVPKTIRGARFVESVKVQFTVPISFILEGIKRAQKFPPVSKKLEIESQAEFAILIAT